MFKEMETKLKNLGNKLEAIKRWYTRFLKEAKSNSVTEIIKTEIIQWTALKANGHSLDSESETGQGEKSPEWTEGKKHENTVRRSNIQHT